MHVCVVNSAGHFANTVVDAARLGVNYPIRTTKNPRFAHISVYVHWCM